MMHHRLKLSFTPGLLLGIGLGGFFDGIVFHQLLQWHHMISNTHISAADLHGLRFNVFVDGLFHAATYLFTIAGLVLLWRHAGRPQSQPSTQRLLSAMITGFGLFNVAEGLINHHVFQLHHVNETVPSDQWLLWDLAFLLWGAAMLIGGWAWFHHVIVTNHTRLDTNPAPDRATDTAPH